MADFFTEQAFFGQEPDFLGRRRFGHFSGEAASGTPGPRNRVVPGRPGPVHTPAAVAFQQCAQALATRTGRAESNKPVLYSSSRLPCEARSRCLPHLPPGGSFHL